MYLQIDIYWFYFYLWKECGVLTPQRVKKEKKRKVSECKRLLQVLRRNARRGCQLAVSPVDRYVGTREHGVDGLDRLVAVAIHCPESIPRLLPRRASDRSCLLLGVMNFFSSAISPEWAGSMTQIRRPRESLESAWKDDLSTICRNYGEILRLARGYSLGIAARILTTSSFLIWVSPFCVLFRPSIRLSRFSRFFKN